MYKHVLVPVAPDHINDCSGALAAARLLLMEGGRLSVLSVLEELPSYIGSYFSEDHVQNSISEFTQQLKSAVPAQDVQTFVVSGHPTNSILTWAESNDVDCIAVSSHRPGLSDYLLGSTAARIVRHAKSSVIVLR